MVIILALYLVIVWLVFFKFKLVPFNWPWRIVVLVSGAAVALTFIALINTLVPQGRLVVYGHVAEIAPDVAGIVLAVPVEANTHVKKGDVLFQIDSAPFQFKVRQLEAAFADAQQKAARLKADLQGADAEVAGLTSQFNYAKNRFDDITKLTQSGASAQFKQEDASAQVNTLTAQLQGAQARQRSLKLAAESEIGGENTAVAQTRAQLDDARRDLEHTTVRAPFDGYASNIGLTPGSRATPTRSALAFLADDDLALVAVFPQNGLSALKPGARVSFFLNDAPGKIYETKVQSLLRGVGEGQAGASGGLARVNTFSPAAGYPARLEIPERMDKAFLLPGVGGVATAYHENAGPIGVIGTILTHIAAWLAYL